jgi:hypothetical protein
MIGTGPPEVLREDKERETVYALITTEAQQCKGCTPFR